VKILTVVGNRPQFIKAAAVSWPLRAAGHEEVLVHTGQHYDENLSQVFFDELEIPKPDHQLGVGGGTNTSQTARMLKALEPLIAAAEPDAVLVYGDTNSTLAGAVAGAQAGVGVVHVEAGMRSYDRTMPEELNRVLTDHASELLLCPSESAAENLRAESVAGRVEVVGDVMVDVLLGALDRARADEEALESYGVRPGEYLLATVHRAGNVDDPARLKRVVELLGALPGPVVLPLHPRTRARAKEAGLLVQAGDGKMALRGAPEAMVSEPVSYSRLTALLSQARAVVTDSGGVQKEAYVAGVPCVTLRESTEWTETVKAGWNTLVGLDGEAAVAAIEKAPPKERPECYGDGHAAQRCVEAIGEL
jgi:UDP-GlcNAc3NAcA epimerase